MSEYREQLTARIEKLLPLSDQPHADPADIYRSVDIGSPHTTRLVLRELELAGRAESVLRLNSRHRSQMRLYRRAGA
jgi:hypothetical protein